MTGEIASRPLLVTAAFALVPLTGAAVGYWMHDRPWWSSVRIASDPGALRPAFLILTVALFPILRNLQRRLADAGGRKASRHTVLLLSLSCLPALLGLLLLLLGGAGRTLLLMSGLSLVYVAFMGLAGPS